jgi:hypothetical protein
MASVPTTEENAASRHAALNRWWRLLWRQGYDMSSFDSTAQILIASSAYSGETLGAITHGYELLEALSTDPVYIEEIRGTAQSPDASSSVTTRTDWPFYHGIDVIGYCLDELTGEIEWRARQYGTHFYGTPKARISPHVTYERMIIRAGFGDRNRHIIDNKTGERIIGPEIEKYSGTKSEQMVYKVFGAYFRLDDANTGKQIRMYQTEQALAGKNGPPDHFGPILVDKINDLVF